MKACALALLWACERVPPAPLAEPLPPDVPIPRTDGAIAGPRYVVDAAPPPAVPTDVPGQGVLSPYVSMLRRDLTDRMAGCVPEGAHGAMLSLVLSADGAVTNAVLARSSGVPAWDECLTTAVAAGAFEAPPFELLQGGSFSTNLVFR